MSAWRRHALQRLPQHRGRIDRAEGPADLWRGLLTIVLDSADNPSLDTSGASAVFRYAALCQSSASEDVRCAVREQFYPYALVGLRERLHLVLNESEWDKAEELMAPVLTPEELVTARQGFFRGLAQLDDQRPITTLRRIKDRIASARRFPYRPEWSMHGVSWSGCSRPAKVQLVLRSS